MSEVTEFYYLPGFFTAYRKRPGKLSLKRKQRESGFIILKEACMRYPYGIDLKRKRLAVLYYRLGEYDWHHNNYCRSLINYFLAGIFDPFRTVDFVLKKIKVL